MIMGSVLILQGVYNIILYNFSIVYVINTQIHQLSTSSLLEFSSFTGV